MEILKHRVLDVHDIDPRFGIEIDVRDINNELVVSHDPPNDKSPKLKDFFEVQKNQLFAINIKSVEIEKQLKEIISYYKIKNYFTFDWPIPSLFKAINSNLITAFRLSEYENYIYKNCDWVWIDSFHSIWYSTEQIKSLKKHGFKIALVSPELHKRYSDLERFREIVSLCRIDAICTDHPEKWY